MSLSHRLGKSNQFPEELALHSVILAQQAAIEGLEASRRELESIVEHLLSATHRIPNRETTDGGNSLSKRETEVLALMVAGKTSKEIAAQLGISFKTAVTHRANIMSKMNVHETASVVREAIRRGLV
ncbi:MAG TPA: LuxR C-terminal-related transcriptional regulator [Bryobacteraceae bacterium]